MAKLTRDDCLASMRTLTEFGIIHRKEQFLEMPIMAYLKFIHDRLKAKDCPQCGNVVEADFVDNGVGMEQSGPYVCNPDQGGCGWVQPGIDDIIRKNHKE